MTDGEWYIDEDLGGGAARVVEVGAGGNGTPGLVAVFELREHAEFCVWARNHGREMVEWVRAVARGEVTSNGVMQGYAQALLRQTEKVEKVAS